LHLLSRHPTTWAMPSALFGWLFCAGWPRLWSSDFKHAQLCPACFHWDGVLQTFVWIGLEPSFSQIDLSLLLNCDDSCMPHTQLLIESPIPICGLFSGVGLKPHLSVSASQVARVTGVGTCDWLRCFILVIWRYSVNSPKIWEIRLVSVGILMGIYPWRSCITTLKGI
jgi:hypothetical protein